MRDSDERDGLFSTTQWSVVLAAGDSQHPNAREALAALYKVYWYPVYAQIRFRGQDPEAAKDLTQGFFVQLLEKHTLKVANPDRGRFRSFLKNSVDHYLSHERHRASALKRGGNKPAISLDFDSAEAQYKIEPAQSQAPDKLFEKRWARAALNRVLERLGEEARAAGDGYRFQRLAPFLTGRTPGIGYKDVAAELEMTEGAVKVAVHRMRRRYGKLLRAEVARTVSDPGEVDGEIRYLFSAMDG